MATKPLPAIQALIHTYDQLMESASPAAAVAALYAYEAQVPEIARSKREGLQRFYDLTTPSAVAYFTLHEEADLRHRAEWSSHLATHSSEPTILPTVERCLRALWSALDAIHPEACAA